jgi:hypothetical protein
MSSLLRPSRAATETPARRYGGEACRGAVAILPVPVRYAPFGAVVGAAAALSDSEAGDASAIAASVGPR